MPNLWLQAGIRYITIAINIFFLVIKYYSKVSHRFYFGKKEIIWSRDLDVGDLHGSSHLVQVFNDSGLTGAQTLVHMVPGFLCSTLFLCYLAGYEFKSLLLWCQLLRIILATCHLNAQLRASFHLHSLISQWVSLSGLWELWYGWVSLQSNALIITRPPPMGPKQTFLIAKLLCRKYFCGESLLCY
jgi:hypothetical protein